MKVSLSIEKISGNGMTPHYYWEILDGEKILMTGRDDSLAWTMTEIEGALYQVATERLEK